MLFPMKNGAASIDTSAKELANFIMQVQTETKSPKMNLIGYSVGGLIGRDYLAHDQENNIQAVVAIGGTDHGIALGGISNLIHALPRLLLKILGGIIFVVIGPSGNDMLAGSSLIQRLAKYPETRAGIHYLNIGSKDDFLAAPHKTTFLKPVPGANVTNIEVHSNSGNYTKF